MNFRRIHVVGGSGSGTTTLGAELARRLGATHLDADDYFWMPTQPPFTTKRDPVDRLGLILADQRSTPDSILSGSVISWGTELGDSFDLIVRLEIPAALRMARLRAREIQRYGRVNEDFMAWAARYDDGDKTVRSRRALEEWLSHRSAPVLLLEGDLSVEARTQAVLERLNASSRI